MEIGHLIFDQGSLFCLRYGSRHYLGFDHLSPLFESQYHGKTIHIKVHIQFSGILVIGLISDKRSQVKFTLYDLFIRKYCVLM